MYEKVSVYSSLYSSSSFTSLDSALALREVLEVNDESCHITLVERRVEF